MKSTRFLAFLSFFSLASLFAEPVSLEYILTRSGGRLLWEPLLKKGMIIRGERSVTFSTEYPLMLLDDAQVLAAGSIIYTDNRITFSEDAAAAILSYLLQNDVVSRTSRFRIAGILIDPGHGGRDSGAVSLFPVDGVETYMKEKNLVLEISLRLEERLRQRYPDKEILMTRTTDIYPTLESRVKQANDFDLEEGEGIVFISIHANASLNSKAQGFEVWYLPETYRRTVLNPAEGDNDALTPILNTLLEEEFTMESKKLAELMLDRMDIALGEHTENRGIKEESWFVVRNAMMASILVEMGFITNREETVRLRDPAYLMNLTDGIYNGIVDFVDFFEN